MASLIPGFEYDIFISYRQKDNKHDGWVTEFVKQLKGELEATFKEDISIYFDENPSDGLLETHNVDKSLESKLKCLIFIPIISQTYCDPKSYAWQHEFCAFNKFAKEDPFGRDIRLSSGNVTSRILPVKIHDLDPEDKTLLENELGGVLRCIEFIYKEAGVNRPLKPNDDVKENLNKTHYINQVNKVANAIKEIISALKNQNQHPDEVSKEDYKEKPVYQKNLRTKIIAGSIILLALIVAGYFFIPKLFKPAEQLEKSVAVLPFENLSNDKDQVWFSDGITDVIITQLSKISDLRVLGRTSTLKYKEEKKSISEIGKELGVNFIIEGTVQRQENNMRITVQLIRVINEDHIWSDIYDREWKDIFEIQSDIAQRIAEELKTVLTPEEIKKIEKRPTENLEAYNYYLRGNEFYWQSNNSSALKEAITMYEKAIELDPNFALAYSRLSISHSRIFITDQNNERLISIKATIDSALKIDPNLPEAHLALGAYYYNTAFDYSKALEQIDIAEQQLPNNSECAYWKTAIYRRSGSWELAKEYAIKSFELDPGSAVIANQTGQTLSKMREFPEAEFYFKKSISNNPQYSQPYTECIMMYLRWKGNTLKAREIVEEASKSLGSDSKIYISWYKSQMEFYDANYQKVLTYYSDIIDIDSTYNATRNYRVLLLYATVYNLINQPGKAYSYFNTARKLLNSEILQNPDNSTLYGNLGIAYAGLGQKKKAIEAGKKAVELTPISKDTWIGTSGIENLAKIYVMVGEYDAALEQIKFLLSVPANLTPQILLLDPTWKPLWDLPEFKKIISTANADAKHN
jgi:TolB-like protein/Flp pilus assembly protein TadD